MFSDLQGRNAVVFGVANKRSIAWSIAQRLHATGVKLAVTYQNERLEQEAKDLILSLPGAEAYMCDVSKDEDIDRLFATLKQRHGKLHALVHSVAYAPADELKGDFINTTREGFRVAHDVSVYSLIAVSRAAAPLMEDGGSIITMTYYGAEKVVPHYNVMAVAKAALECSVRYLASDLGKKKIRVNAISAGPIKTLAARGISGLGDMLKSHAERAPLGRNVDVKEVGSTGVFLASDASSGITGEVIHVDCGYSIMGWNAQHWLSSPLLCFFRWCANGVPRWSVRARHLLPPHPQFRHLSVRLSSETSSVNPSAEFCGRSGWYARDRFPSLSHCETAETFLPIQSAKCCCRSADHPAPAFPVRGRYRRGKDQCGRQPPAARDIHGPG